MRLPLLKWANEERSKPFDETPGGGGEVVAHAPRCLSTERSGGRCDPAIRRRHAMEISHSVKERTISENSLVIVLQGLHGRITTVELRDESMAVGRIINVDAFMNIRLAEVTFTDRCGRSSSLDDLFVTGRNVRYVHIPDDVDIRATIEKQLQLIQRVRTFGGRDKGRKEFLRQRDK